MNSHVLQLVLQLRTVKWPVLTAALSWLFALALGGYVLWHQHSRNDHVKRITALRGQLSTSSTATRPSAVPIAPGQAFISALGEPDQLDKYLRTLFEIAGKQSINLKQGNYKKYSSAMGNYNAYTIDLPIGGSYAKIKTISEEMLLALPFSALEEIKFKRESIGDAALETQLRFVLYLKSSHDQSKDSNLAPEQKADTSREDGGRL